MPAMTKDALLQIAEADFAKLMARLQAVPEAVALQKDADDTSIKDVVAHRAHWIDLFLGWYADGQAGKEVFFPAPGYKWNELKRYNAVLRDRQTGLGWTVAISSLVEAHGRLVNFLERRSNEELYGAPMKGAKNHWTPGRWAEAAGPSHYRSAAKYVRARLRELKAA